MSHTVRLSATLRRLLVELETWCTADCCKARAFDVSQTAVERWLEYERIDRTQELADEILSIDEALQRTDGRVLLDARGLESDWDAAGFRAFWEQFADSFASAVSERTVQRAKSDAADE